MLSCGRFLLGASRAGSKLRLSQVQASLFAWHRSCNRKHIGFFGIVGSRKLADAGMGSWPTSAECGRQVGRTQRRYQDLIVLLGRVDVGPRRTARTALSYHMSA